jgi:hypothetical protein
LLVLLASGEARAEDAPVRTLDWLPRLRAPTWLAAPGPRPSGTDLQARRAGTALHPLKLSLDASMSYLRLAVHGDGRPGLAPFLGTSAASLGGFRLRF